MPARWRLGGWANGERVDQIGPKRTYPSIVKRWSPAEGTLDHLNSVIPCKHCEKVVKGRIGFYMERFWIFKTLVRNMKPKPDRPDHH